MDLSFCWDTARNVAARSDIPWERFDGKTFFVTGSTGLIGSQLVRTLICRSSISNKPINIIAPIRNTTKARYLFGDCELIEFIEWRMGEAFKQLSKADFIVHAASSTSSSDFSNRPVEIIESIYSSAREVLHYAEWSDCERVLLLSTMEVYGDLKGKIVEGMGGNLDSMNPRSSYPEAKRLAECLFASYAVERRVHASVARLTQTFGEGVDSEDGRVFAEFARCASRGDDIVLLTDGSKCNQYLSVDDSVRAILFLLAKGEDGVAYNVANSHTFCSIREMAELVTRQFGDGNCHIIYGSNPARAATFRNGSKIDLDTSRIETLGWRAEQDLTDMYRAMLSCWTQQRESGID